MLGSTALEVAAGLTLLYLALSLVCSALNEYYSTLLNRRPNHLKSALFDLVNQDDPRGRRFLAMFFSHPLIKALAPSGNVKKSPGTAAPAAPTAATGPASAWLSGDVEAVLKSLKKTPHYIPDRTFADVIVDLLAGRAAATAAPDDVPVPPTPAAAADAIVAEIQEGVGKVSDAMSQKGLRTEVDERAQALRAAIAAAPAPRVAWDAVASALAAIRAKVVPIADAKGRDGLIAIIDRWDARLRAAASDRAAAAATVKGAGETLTALRGLVVGLPESVAKARLRSALDDEQAKLRALDLTATDSASARTTAVAALASVRAAVDPLPHDDSRDAILARLDAADRLTSPNGGVVTLQKIRDAVEALPPSAFKTTLHSLTDEAGTSLDEIKDNLAQWYNDTMDRVSGWYKRNTQVIVFVIALIVSFGLNADTIAITTRLLQDSALRDSAAASARAIIAKDQPPATSSAGPAAGPPAGAPATPPVPANSTPPAAATKDATKSEPAKAAPEIAKAATEPAKAAPEIAKATAAPAKAAGEPARTADAPPTTAAASPPHEFTDAEEADIMKALNRLKLPLGWDETKWDSLAALIGQGKTQSVLPGLQMILGMLITALALTMGAPFWYDVLSKVVNVRSAGEKPEDSTRRGDTPVIVVRGGTTSSGRSDPSR